MSRFPHTQAANRAFAGLIGLTLLVLFGFCAVRLGASTPSSLPPLATQMPTPLGPIEITRVIGLTCDAGNGPQPALGCFSGDDRTLAIRDSIPLVTAWQTYYHEGVHVAFYYGAIQFKNAAMEDHIADVVANQQVMYLLAQKR